MYIFTQICNWALTAVLHNNNIMCSIPVCFIVVVGYLTVSTSPPFSTTKKDHYALKKEHSGLFNYPDVVISLMSPVLFLKYPLLA